VGGRAAVAGEGTGMEVKVGGGWEGLGRLQGGGEQAVAGATVTWAMGGDTVRRWMGSYRRTVAGTGRR